MSKERDESIQIPQAEEEQFPESGKRPAAIYAEFVSQTRGAISDSTSEPAVQNWPYV